MNVEVAAGLWSVNLMQGLGGLASSDHNPLQTLFPGIAQNARVVIVGQSTPRVFEREGLPSLEQIPISAELANDHPLKKFILKNEPLSSADLAQLLKSPHIDLSISGYHGGAVGAAVPSAQEWADPRRYDKNLWLRDFALEFFAVHRAGDRKLSHQMLNRVFEFLGSTEHRGNITGMHFHNDHNNPPERFRTGQAVPQTKMSIQPDGKLGYCTTPWAQQQIDGLTALCNAAYRAANLEADQALKINGVLPLDLRTIDPMPGHCEHVLPAMIKALKGIQIWNASDVGPWEDLWAAQRATGNGIATSMVREAVAFHERFGWNFLNVAYGAADSSAMFRSDVLELNHRCKEVLDRRIPESGFAIECDKRPHDAALILLLYPFKAQLSPAQEYSILRTVYANMGECGFSRFLATLHEDIPKGFKGHPNELKGEPDMFVGQDYHRNTDPGAYGEFSAKAENYRPAQWSLFDALLSGYFYRRYVESGGLDKEALEYGDRHLKRSLSFIVKQDEELFVAGKAHEAHGGKFIIPKGSLPEAKVWDTKYERWINNHNNLLMSRAALALALERAIEAAKWAEHLAIRE